MRKPRLCNTIANIGASQSNASHSLLKAEDKAGWCARIGSQPTEQGRDKVPSVVEL
jgi:hypothetical protein